MGGRLPWIIDDASISRCGSMASAPVLSPPLGLDAAVVVSPAAPSEKREVGDDTRGRLTCNGTGPRGCFPPLLRRLSLLVLVVRGPVEPPPVI